MRRISKDEFTRTDQEQALLALPRSNVDCKEAQTQNKQSLHKPRQGPKESQHLRFAYSACKSDEHQAFITIHSQSWIDMMNSREPKEQGRTLPLGHTFLPVPATTSMCKEDKQCFLVPEHKAKIRAIMEQVGALGAAGKAGRRMERWGWRTKHKAKIRAMMEEVGAVGAAGKAGRRIERRGWRTKPETHCCKCPRFALQALHSLMQLLRNMRILEN